MLGAITVALTAAFVVREFFLGALYLQRVLGYDALQIGLAFLPYTVVQGILSVRYTDRLIARLGARRLIAIGIVPFAAGLALLTRAGTDASYPLDFLPSMLLMGVGGGLSFSPIMTLAMSSATPADAGLVSGLVTTSAQVGGPSGSPCWPPSRRRTPKRSRRTAPHSPRRSPTATTSRSGSASECSRLPWP